MPVKSICRSYKIRRGDFHETVKVGAAGNIFFFISENKLPKFGYMPIAVQWKCKLLSYRLTSN